MYRLVKTSFVVFGIGVGVGVISYIVRLLTAKKEEDITINVTKRTRRLLKIPKNMVGYVLGRNGANIKGIREKTNTRINFDDSENDFTIATIFGTAEDVEEAAILINKIITGRPSFFTKEIVIPDKLSDYLVGKNGENIRQICYESGAKITVDWTPTRDNKTTLKVIVRGRKEEVDKAVEIIDGIVAEAEVQSSKLVHFAGRALPEKTLPLNLSSVNSHLPYEKLIPNSTDGFIEIYVSAVESPSKFWVQISGSKSIQLDKLATEMSDFYNDEKTRAKFQLNNVNVGDIVTAYYEGDNSWYRAQVLKLSEDSNGNEKRADILYLDFGDCATLSPNLICKVKPEYLSIPFQAIECRLAHVEPSDDSWSADATEDFSKLVYLAQWKVIMAKPIQKSDKNEEKAENNTIQSVQLFDTSTSQDINISEELVKKGYAKYV